MMVLAKENRDIDRWVILNEAADGAAAGEADHGDKEYLLSLIHI